MWLLIPYLCMLLCWLHICCSLTILRTRIITKIAAINWSFQTKHSEQTFALPHLYFKKLSREQPEILMMKHTFMAPLTETASHKYPMGVRFFRRQVWMRIPDLIWTFKNKITYCSAELTWTSSDPKGSHWCWESWASVLCQDGHAASTIPLTHLALAPLLYTKFQKSHSKASVKSYAFLRRCINVKLQNQSLQPLQVKGVETLQL